MSYGCRLVAKEAVSLATGKQGLLRQAGETGGAQRQEEGGRREGRREGGRRQEAAGHENPSNKPFGAWETLTSRASDTGMVGWTWGRVQGVSEPETGWVWGEGLPTCFLVGKGSGLPQEEASFPVERNFQGLPCLVQPSCLPGAPAAAWHPGWECSSVVLCSQPSTHPGPAPSRSHRSDSLSELDDSGHRQKGGEHPPCPCLSRGADLGFPLPPVQLSWAAQNI